MKLEDFKEVPCLKYYNTLEWESEFTLGLTLQKKVDYMWHFMGKGLIWSKWSYCQERVVWALSKHLRPIPSPTVENLLRNRHLNLKNGKK